MMLYEAMGLKAPEMRCAAFVGAGGKTTSMYRLARELKQRGFCVIVTTTTKIYYPEKGQYDGIILSEQQTEIDAALRRFEPPGIYVVARGVNAKKKLLGIGSEAVKELLGHTGIDYVLVESDGSRGLPVKAPAEFEPVVPPDAALVAGVIGLDCLGQPVSEKTVHRTAAFCEVTGCRPGDIITSELLVGLALHPSGLFKNAPEKARRCVLLNKADSTEHISEACVIKDRLGKTGLQVIITGYSEQGMKLL